MAQKTAKKKRVSKTQAIRELLDKGENGSPTYIANALAKRGIKVSPAFVSTIKSQEKKKSGLSNGRRSRTLSGRTKAAVATTPLDDLKQASDLLLRAVDLVLCAGAKEARQLINMAEQMVDKISSERK